MKKQALFSLLAAVVLLTAGSLNAQTSNPVKVNIPFDFSAGKSSFSAGEYRIDAISQLGDLAIAGRASSAKLVSSHPIQSASPSSSTKLVFNKYGDRYFLSQIWVEGDDRGRELPQTREEKELASNASPNPVVIMAQK